MNGFASLLVTVRLRFRRRPVVRYFEQEVTWYRWMCGGAPCVVHTLADTTLVRESRATAVDLVFLDRVIHETLLLNKYRVSSKGVSVCHLLEACIHLVKCKEGGWKLIFPRYLTYRSFMCFAVGVLKRTTKIGASLFGASL